MGLTNSSNINHGWATALWFNPQSISSSTDSIIVYIVMCKAHNPDRDEDWRLIDRLENLVIVA